MNKTDYDLSLHLELAEKSCCCCIWFFCFVLFCFVFVLFCFVFLFVCMFVGWLVGWWLVGFLVGWFLGFLITCKQVKMLGGGMAWIMEQRIHFNPSGLSGEQEISTTKQNCLLQVLSHLHCLMYAAKTSKIRNKQTKQRLLSFEMFWDIILHEIRYWVLAEGLKSKSEMIAFI